MRSSHDSQAVSRRAAATVAMLLTLAVPAFAQVEPAPPRSEGEGPYNRLVLRNVMLIDGAGSPPQGPLNIVIEGNRITSVGGGGDAQGANAREIDLTGHYVMPGFVDLHVHTGGVPKAPEAEYMYKLWLAHGITTARGVPFGGGADWALSERARSARNEITAPRMWVYERAGTSWDQGSVDTPEQARAWVRWAAAKGIDGIKLGAHDPDIMEALIDEAKQHGMGTTAHLQQTGVGRMNAIQAARLGLGTVTHFYGIFEALYKDRALQSFPVDYSYNDEQDRFGNVAMQWNMIHERGSDEWNALIDEFLEHETIMDPTMVAYLASREVMRTRNADWHTTYTLPSLWDFYAPSRDNHGSYYWDWSTWEETAWRNFYRVWMNFLNDYKNAGGRVTVSSDAGFIYNLYGFSTINEMELLQEAGFHPLEVLRGATLHGAEALFEPREERIQFGVVRAGMLADLVVVGENPIKSLKVLYGTGQIRLNNETGQAERVGGIRYTIKDGIVYDAKELLADVARMVEEQKRERGLSTLPDIIFENQ
ncbi:MAG: amidohydrolase [Gemmatimonadota bacterium]